MYRQSSTFEQSESLQKDALISTLKKELYELQDKEHEFAAINDRVNNQEAHYALKNDEKQRIQNEHKMKGDINRRAVAELRTEIDSLKIQIHKCAVNIQDILRESAGLRRACENRENEIASLMGSNQQTEAKNQQLEQQNKATLNKIRGLKEERNKIDSQNQKLQKALEDAINNLKSLQKEARMLQSSNNKLSSMLLVAEKDHSELIEEIKSRDNVVTATNKKLEQLNKELEGLKDKIGKLDKECAKNDQELSNMTDQLENQIEKNKEQTKKIKQAENTLRAIENELDKALLEREALENDNQDLNAQYKLLDTQIDAILRQIIECERINNDMQKEIENYIQFDQQARSMLDRKAAMRKLLETVSVQLGQTSSHIAHLR